MTAENANESEKYNIDHGMFIVCRYYKQQT